MKVRIDWSLDVKVAEAPPGFPRMVELSLAQFGEQMEGVIAEKLRGQFPDVDLSFGPIEEDAR